MIIFEERSNNVDLRAEIEDKVVSVKELMKCTEYASNLGLYRLKVGFDSIKFKPVPKWKEKAIAQQLNTVNFTVSVSGTVKTNKEHRTKFLKAKHKFYLYALDGRIWEIKLVTTCSCKSSTSKYDDYLLSICSIYAKGILRLSNLKGFTTAVITLPDNYDDLVVYHHNFFDHSAKTPQIQEYPNQITAVACK